ncbi:1-phosphatidylinositol-3-phosphate 5-kinase FAB1B-like isoform X2 [Magnolia sinica]|uniref:1-phosphatidylinositol-3-phosphate 5-kinase FAB1B-like isoform X2 n=1 Tax=Magnolia sinica TaxID=86752 RepID=UPI00265B6670|nr:1-phosphatidylinositol-3-phosphate 5-kinase FAB1B-like isoform X2 [Magnolia sinica]
MPSMCHVCSALLMESGIEYSVSLCNICLQKYELEPSKEDSSSAYATPLTSPAPSLSCYESCISSLGDFLSDLNFQSREDGDEETPDTGQEHCNPEFSGYLEDQELENIDIQNYDAQNESDGFKFAKSVDEVDEFSSKTVENVEKESIELSPPLDIETDLRIWIPPPPEDKDDDIESSVADTDDDDNEYNVGMEWGWPSSLSSSYRFREERKKAMVEVMNGRFRALVRQLLAWASVSLSEEAGENWLDILTSLSWEAAILVKPEATDGKPMDPGSYVKVKCIESGSRSQSQVIRGLVFKKNAAHKHMPTKYMNPRLLLLQGVLGQHAGELLSLDSMKQEKKDYLKSIIDMIELCHPNVILVEKNVSRDVQESILAKGMTLVFDMKLSRLERIACCTGSQIVPAASDLVDPKLKTCDSFHIEKVIEEHGNCGEGGKHPIKTLMFFEGCPRPLGCTILLKGARNDELKKVKCVMRHAVSQAYHLIQETSFLVDQRTIFSNTRLEIGLLREKKMPFVGFSCAIDSNDSSVDSSTAGISSLHAVDIPICNECPEKSISDPSTFTHVSFKEKEPDYRSTGAFPASYFLERLDHEVELRGRTNLEKKSCGVVGLCGKAKSGKIDIDNEVEMLHKDEVEMLLDPEWILVLLTSRCVLKGTVCKQNHLYRVRFYRDSDISLGRFLHDVVLNQKHHCSTCGESPDAHSYSYTYQNGKLAIRVKRLPPEMLLPGEAKRKLWMWTLCLKCNRENGILKHTRRVVMSSAARGLSFGKFLELCISDDSTLSRLSTCGHLLHRDCLQFYGLGSVVAMFSYSPIDIYTACQPPPVLEFYNPNGQEWLHSEAKDVLEKGNLLFMEVMNSLQKIMSEVTSSGVNQPIKDLSEIEAMLQKEKSDFEEAIDKNGKLGQTVHQILNLNRLNHELLLELYVWDRRLQSLRLSTADNNATHEEQLRLQKDDISDGRTQRRNTLEYGGDGAFEDSPHIAHHTRSLSNVKTELEIEAAKASISADNLIGDDNFPNSKHTGSKICNSTDAEATEGLAVESQPSAALITLPLIGKDNDEEYMPISDQLQAGQDIPISGDALGQTETVTDLNPKIEYAVNNSALDDVYAPLKELCPGTLAPLKRLPSNLDDYEKWVWTPFSETCKAYRKDFQRGYLQKFDFVNSYTPSYLSLSNQLISGERSTLHFPVDADDNIVSAYEEDFSSIIACGLALLQDQYSLAENAAEKDRRIGKQQETSKSNENTYGLFPNVVMPFPLGTSNGPLDLEGIHSQELTELGLEGFFSVDSLLFSKSLHTEVSLGVGKLRRKGKYSVICIYAKQFYALRRHCCPSEIDYISSLCRSKKWDAQGGKSGAFFAKTLDDRFIVKQIKKIELESFLQFGLEYFKHISQSLNSGSQTCLAKILGIYQVIIRKSKSRKHVKVNLMVMENIFFGRNISRLYDLKGVLHSRYNSDANGTLLDQNFVADVLASPYFVGGKTKQHLQRAIWNDTSFLTSVDVMDYSLLLGVDKDRRELVYGIVDYLRQYTWDKHLETWVKTSLVVPKNELPTVISPKEYRKRFRKFMSTYFFTVPDRCCSDRFFGPHKYCGEGGDGFTWSNNAGPTEISNKQRC